MGLISYILDGYVNIGVAQGNPDAIDLARRREEIRRRKEEKKLRKRNKKAGAWSEGDKLATWVASQNLMNEMNSKSK